MATTQMTLAKDIPWAISTDIDLDWQLKWPEMRVKDIDPVEVVADLYIPEGLACHGFVNISGIDPLLFEPAMILETSRVLELASILRLDHEQIAKYEQGKADMLLSETPLQKMGRIAREAKSYQAALVNDVIPTFRAYAHAACGGELRHHPAVGGISLPSVRKGAWTGWKDVFELHGLPALQLMSKLFREMKGSSIGGEKWAIASDILFKYEICALGPTTASNNKIFLDRVLALQHNGGCFLSKRTWGNHRTMKDGKIGNVKVSTITTSHQSMLPVLECHASDPPNVVGLLACASKEVEKMTLEYFAAAKDAGLELSVESPTKVEYPLTGLGSPLSAHSKPAKVLLPPLPAATTTELATAFASCESVATAFAQQSPHIQAYNSSFASAQSLVDSGKFNLEIKVTQLTTADGTVMGDANSEVSLVPKKIYPFGWGKSSLFQPTVFSTKSFHFSHMIKTMFPGARATSVLVRFKNDSGKTKYFRINSNYGLTKLTGASLLWQAEAVANTPPLQEKYLATPVVQLP